MSAYIDKVYFDSYSDLEIDSQEFNVLASRATDMINSMTRDLQGIGFTSLPLSFQDKVKKATAAQVETLYQNGGTDSLVGGNLASASIGKFSYSEGSAQSGASIPISPLISMYLGDTGLLYRGVAVT